MGTGVYVGVLEPENLGARVRALTLICYSLTWINLDLAAHCWR